MRAATRSRKMLMRAVRKHFSDIYALAAGNAIERGNDGATAVAVAVGGCIVLVQAVDFGAVDYVASDADAFDARIAIDFARGLVGGADRVGFVGETAELDGPVGAAGAGVTGWRGGEGSGFGRGDQMREMVPGFGCVGSDGDRGFVDGGGSDVEFGIAIVEDGDHAAVARGVRGSAENDADQADVAIDGRGDEIVAGGIGVAGFHAVSAGIGFEQVIVVGDHLPAPDEAGGAEQPVLVGEIAHQVAGKQGEIGGCGDLAGIRQAGGVAEIGACHAKRVGAQGHHLGEMFFGAAHQFTQGTCRIIGGFGDQCQHGLANGDVAAGNQAEFRGGLAGGVGRDGDAFIVGDAVIPQRLEGQVEGHHFGQRGRVAFGVGVDG